MIDFTNKIYIGTGYSWYCVQFSFNDFVLDADEDLHLLSAIVDWTPDFISDDDSW